MAVISPAITSPENVPSVKEPVAEAEMVIFLLTPSPSILMLSPATNDNVSVGFEAIISEEFALTVPKVFWLLIERMSPTGSA